MMKRSSAFFAVIIVLAVVRYLARGFFDRFLSLEQTGAIFYLLAFGMILRWRAEALLRLARPHRRAGPRVRRPPLKKLRPATNPNRPHQALHF